MAVGTERACRADTVNLWHKIRTVEDPTWTARYHSRDPNTKAFGGRVTVVMEDGEVIVDEIAVADAHPLGARPFARPEYIAKFRALTDGIVESKEQERFLDTVEQLLQLPPKRLSGLTVTVPAKWLRTGEHSGLFDYPAKSGVVARSTTPVVTHVA